MLAFEISVNGEVLCTVGAEDWGHLATHIEAHRYSADATKDVPCHATTYSFVGIPTSTSGGKFDTRMFDSKVLVLGDSVTVRLVETDAVDSPRDESADGWKLGTPSDLDDT